MLRQFVFSAWVRTARRMVAEVGEEGERAILAPVKRHFVTTERQFTTVPMTWFRSLPRGSDLAETGREGERVCVCILGRKH